MAKYYRIDLTADFADDISDICNYIQRDSMYYALKTKNGIEERISNLIFFPFMGRRLVDSENHDIFNLREIFYKSYRIIYGIKSDIIYVRRVLHSARLISKNLIKT